MIKLENIAKIYRMGKVEVPALRGIDLTINQGEMVALVGVSGSGKSTLMNIIGFLDKPTTGKYMLEGVDVSYLNDNKLAELRNKKVGFVFQTFNLLPRVSALSNVELPLIYSGGGGRRKSSLEALERLHQEGITVILVTHEMDVATQAQRIIRLLDGKIISDEKVTHNDKTIRKRKDTGN